jgi:hypothetical protein
VIQNVEKIKDNDKYALVTMKRKVYTQLNGKIYDKTEIIFEPQGK